jgi:soluble lytic murein transglycosylase-like protein
MYGFRERVTRGSNRTARGGSPGRFGVLRFAVAGLVVAASGCAPSMHSGTSGKTVPSWSELAPATVESSYVSHIMMPLEIAPEDALINLDPPSEEGRAAAYARRYGISQELALDIVEHAKVQGLDPELGFRLVRVESVFKVSARGPQGALGLTQLMPSTARSLDRSLDTEREVLDPDRNLEVGFRYLRQMIERYDDVRLGLLAFNRGETAVDRALGGGADPENGYSHKVLGTRGSKPYQGPGLLPPPVSDHDPS